MPRSFLLKRFSTTLQLPEEEKNSKKGQDIAQYDESYLSGRETVWSPQSANVLYMGMGWNRAHLNPHHQDVVHRMIYNDFPSLGSESRDIYGDNPELNDPESTAKNGDKKQAYKCNQCGKVFKTKYTLTIHLKMPSHTGARPFVCAICGKGFRLSSTLCRHKIIHTSHKPHRCQTCGKAFNRSSTLKTHQRTHSDVKEFTCDICGKGFHQKGNLRNHLLIHSGEKPYKCTLCKKAFNKLSNLKFHMHVHTDNKPYRCRFCKESFARRCELKDHLSKCCYNVADNS